MLCVLRLIVEELNDSACPQRCLFVDLSDGSDDWRLATIDPTTRDHIILVSVLSRDQQAHGAIFTPDLDQTARSSPFSSFMRRLFNALFLLFAQFETPYASLASV